MIRPKMLVWPANPTTTNSNPLVSSLTASSPAVNPQICRDRRKRHVHARLDEEEGREQGEGHHPEAALLLPVGLEDPGHGETQNEGGEDRVALRPLGEVHQDQ